MRPRSPRDERKRSRDRERHHRTTERSPHRDRGSRRPDSRERYEKPRGRDRSEEDLGSKVMRQTSEERRAMFAQWNEEDEKQKHENGNGK
jgi:hypothetical protein